MGVEAQHIASANADSAKSIGNDDDTWAASATKFRRQLEGLLAEQVQAAASSFENSAKQVCEDISSQFMQSVVKLARDFNDKHDRTERDNVVAKDRMDKAEAANLELKASFARLQAIVSEAEKRVPLLDVTNPSAWNREPDPVTFWCGASIPMAEIDVRKALADWFRAAGIQDTQISFNTAGVKRRHSFSLIGGSLLA